MHHPKRFFEFLSAKIKFNNFLGFVSCKTKELKLANLVALNCVSLLLYLETR